MEYLPLLPILLFSVVLHEIAHGWMALRLGDPTARDLGRLTLNPLPHIDLIGSIVVPALSLLTAGTVFIAWAKPVPVNPGYFKHQRRDDILVSVVGPLSNLVVAAACALLYGITIALTGSVNTMPEGTEREVVLFIQKMFSFGITMNIFLAVFNLLPVPPLDGSHVVASLLPPELGVRYRQIGFAGIILILLMMRVPFVRDGMIAVVRAVEVPYHFIIQLFL
jgi:Zn-dependent protease